MTQYVRQTLEDGVASVLLDDPSTRNALNTDMARQLAAAFDGCAANEAVRAVVLSGAGAHFSAGGNLHEARRASEGGAPATAAFMAAFDAMTHAAYHCPKPVIAVARGSVAGGALGLMLCADVVFLAESARIVQAFIHIGLVPDCGSSLLLAQRVGHARAAQLCYTGRTVPAGEALAMGLGDHLLPDAEVDAGAGSLAAAIAAQSPEAIRQTKQMLRAANADALRAALDREAQRQGLLLQAPDFRSRVDAFLQKKSAARAAR